MSGLSAEYLFRKLIKMMVPNVNVPVSMNFSFTCRNCFPRKIGILSMPGENSAWQRTVFLCELCVEQLYSEALAWNCCHWVLSVVRVRWSSMHISMDVGKCPACSILSLLGNFAVISFVECFLKFAMVKTVIPCNLAVIPSTDLVWYGSLSKASFRSLGSKHILSFFLTVWLVNGDCQCPFLQLQMSLPNQYVLLPLLVSLVLLET